MTVLNDRLQKIEDEIRERFGEEVVRECVLEDPVRIEIIYHRFVSRSKGIRNGKRRYRREIKEIRLLKRNNQISRFTQWHRFQFDQEATEIKQGADGEWLKERIDNVWGY